MRKAVLKKARETLEGMRSQLLRSVKQGLQEGREASKDEGMDTYDIASDARDRETSLALADRDRDKLQAIDEALGRVEDGSYGICEMCESDIAEARLLELPGRAREGSPHEPTLRGGSLVSADRRQRRRRRGILLTR